ncbi:2OG-Fe(II) oxygenase [Zhouia sp. PK063]|uniref:2OG-Fe(II) oxygenase n=1 Tax=Zhouia sp. PK063 TaxID=3373602 RepID=UPI0037B80E31
MESTELFEQLDFRENPLYETIIDELLEQQYSIIDNFFSAKEILALRQSLLHKYEDDCFKKSAIGNRVNENIITEIRGDFILWLNETYTNDAENIFFSKINDLVNYLNKTCFLGILSKEFHYALYPKGKYYQRHLDTFQNDDRRKLSFVCYLNDEHWTTANNGGELVIYTHNNGKETTIPVTALPGRVVIFESQVLEHEVKPVLQGERLSITGWLKTR